jgi:hypothetical protein
MSSRQIPIFIFEKSLKSVAALNDFRFSLKNTLQGSCILQISPEKVIKTLDFSSFPC